MNIYFIFLLSSKERDCDGVALLQTATQWMHDQVLMPLQHKKKVEQVLSEFDSNKSVTAVYLSQDDLGIINAWRLSQP